ncbi:MAG TPA: hypothetical protein VHZ50_12920, partial [Puia sp.]|nr:hypothetical protein [Puia sp.]
MKKISFISFVLLLSIVACNSSGDKSAGDTTAAAATDTTMHHMDSSSMVAPMQAIPAGAKVFFKNLKDGQTVKSPLKIEFGVEGIALDS